MCFLLIVIFISLANIPNTFRILTTSISNKTYCYKSPVIDLTLTIELSILRSIIPFLIISTLNILTLKTLLNSRIRLNRSIENEIKFSIVLVMSGLFFVLFNFPLAFTDIAYNVYLYVYFYDPDSFFMINLDLTVSFTRLFSFAYYGISFFINIFFNQKFRKNLLLLLRL